MEESVTLLRETGDRYQLTTALNNLANVVSAQGGSAEARSIYDEALSIIRELGDGWAAAYLLEDVARFISLTEQARDTIVLLSAAGALRETIDAPLPAAEQASLDALQKKIKVELGPEFTKGCVEMGQAMSMEEAIAFARQTIS